MIRAEAHLIEAAARGDSAALFVEGLHVRSAYQSCS